jgi:serine protease Do
MMPLDTYRSATVLFVALLCGAGSAVRPEAAPAVPRLPVLRLANLPGATAMPAPARPVTPMPQQSRPAGVAEARDFSAAFADVAAEVTPTVVRIQTEQSLSALHRNVPGQFDDLFDRLPEDHPSTDFPQLAGGSGVLVTADGLILTNNHVIAGADRITVTLWDKRAYDATVVGADPTTDVALIVIDEGGLPHATLGDSDRLRVGEWVLAIGNPGFRDANTLDFTVTSGIVSAKGRPLDVIQSELARRQSLAARYAIEDFIQTDAAINPGNSGGPLIDLAGNVVGINTAIASVNGVNQGYGFAVPVNVARRVMRDLLEFGRVRRPLLGISIQNVTVEDAQVYDLPRIAGVLVEDFAPDSPARRAGLERHDVIVGIDGTGVDRLGQFQRLVAAHDPGDVVEVDVVRFGRGLTFPVELTEADLGSSRVVRTAPASQRATGIGIQLLEHDRGEGALISQVVPASPADRKGIPAGLVIREINRTPITSADQARKILDGLGSGAVASLLLELPDDGGTLIRNVRIP